MRTETTSRHDLVYRVALHRSSSFYLHGRFRSIWAAGSKVLGRRRWTRTTARSTGRPPCFPHPSRPARTTMTGPCACRLTWTPTRRPDFRRSTSCLPGPADVRGDRASTRARRSASCTRPVAGQRGTFGTPDTQLRSARLIRDVEKGAHGVDPGGRHDGQGLRLVRQRVGLHQPPRRPDRDSCRTGAGRAVRALAERIVEGGWQ